MKKLDIIHITEILFSGIMLCAGIIRIIFDISIGSQFSILFEDAIWIIGSFGLLGTAVLLAKK